MARCKHCGKPIFENQSVNHSLYWVHEVSDGQFMKNCGPDAKTFAEPPDDPEDQPLGWF